MKIQDINHQPVAACVVLNYRGFDLSLSAIFQPSNMRVFRGKQDVTGHFSPKPFTFNEGRENGLAPTAEMLQSVMHRIDSLYTVNEVTDTEIDVLIGLKA